MVWICSSRRSGACWMVGHEFYEPADETAVLGSVETAGGEGSEVLLLGLSGGLRWASGCLTKVFGGLNWTVEICGGSLLVGRFLDRTGYRCLKWKVRSVAGLKAEGLVVWEGGVPVNYGVEFGEV